MCKYKLHYKKLFLIFGIFTIIFSTYGFLMINEFFYQNQTEINNTARHSGLITASKSFQGNGLPLEGTAYANYTDSKTVTIDSTAEENVSLYLADGWDAKRIQGNISNIKDTDRKSVV